MSKIISFNYNCNEFHSNCLNIFNVKFISLFKSSFKGYLILYIAQYILSNYNNITKLRFKNINRDKFYIIYMFILKIVSNSIRSSCYMISYFLILRATSCLISKFLGYYNIYLAVSQTLLGSIASIIETSNRSGALSSYFLSRSVISLGDLLIKLKYIYPIKNFIYCLFSFIVPLNYIISNGLIKDYITKKNKMLAFINNLIIN